MDSHIGCDKTRPARRRSGRGGARGVSNLTVKYGFVRGNKR